jgi:hypothetical protein
MRKRAIFAAIIGPVVTDLEIQTKSKGRGVSK